MNLELKHIAPYLPYGLKGAEYENGELFVLAQIDLTKKYPIIWESNSRLNICRTDCKPILRPLSDLTKEIEVDGEKFVPIMNLQKCESETIVSEYSSDGDKTKTLTITYKLMGDTFTDFVINRNSIEFTDYKYVSKLVEWHFDLFGLITQGLAIDINTLEK